MIDEMPTAVLPQFADEGFPVREVEDRRRGREVLLNQHDSPRPVEHPQGERALGPCDLVVVELHGIDSAAAKFVVLGVRPEDGSE